MKRVASECAWSADPAGPDQKNKNGQTGHSWPFFMVRSLEPAGRLSGQGGWPDSQPAADRTQKKMSALVDTFKAKCYYLITRHKVADCCLLLRNGKK